MFSCSNGSVRNVRGGVHDVRGSVRNVRGGVHDVRSVRIRLLMPGGLQL